MPIYEYDCKKCGRFEVIQKITDEPLACCKDCGEPVRKLVSLSSFALVGGGWYKDLYSSTSSKAGTGTDKGNSTGSSTSPPASTISSTTESTSSPSKTKDSTAAA